ncbi:MAG: hypothetical protein V4689_01310 [Verrucomicrobiota bacterium]
MPDQPPLAFGKIEHRKSGGVEELKAKVDGKWLWIELTGGELKSTPEAWATFGLYPAMTTGRRIRLRDQPPPDKLWAGNAKTLMTKMTGWWGGTIPKIVTDRHPSWWRRFALPWRSKKRLLFFSGGVDSFHALHEMIQQGVPPDALLFVDGFDIDLTDTAKSEAYLPALEEICRHHRIKLLRLKTNLRKMPFYRKHNWEFTYGLAMGGVAHLIRSYGEVFISSSFETIRDIPYGSRVDVDVLFTSGTKRFHHVGSGILRTTKLMDICHDPLVQRHLRVCWKGRGARKNCGECEKCLRTELNVLATGEYEKFTCFDHPESIAARLGRIETHMDRLVRMWQAAKDQSLPPDLDQAVKAMLRRSLGKLKTVPTELASEHGEIEALVRYCGYKGELVFDA